MNPIYWMTRLKPTPTVLRITFAATILVYCLNRADFIVNPMFNAIEQLGGREVETATGFLSIPFWSYRLLQFCLLLFLPAAWKAIWHHGFGFKKVNWFYFSDFYTQFAMTGLLVIVALLHILSLPVAISLREFYSNLSIVQTAAINIAFLVALIQIARMPGTANGLKEWFVTTGMCTIIFTIFRAPLLIGVAGTAFAVVQLILIRRMLKTQHSDPQNATQS